MHTKTQKLIPKQQTLSNEIKILFLDFDGVLTSYDEGSYVSNPFAYGPSLTICKKVIKLCDETKAKIIISSNWRRFELDDSYSINNITIKNPLPKLYDILGKYIIGQLPPYRHTTKSEALILWFEETNYKGTHWVILDDDKREGLGTTSDFDIKHHYIEINPIYGITDKNIEQIKKIIG